MQRKLEGFAISATGRGWVGGAIGRAENARHEGWGTEKMRALPTDPPPSAQLQEENSVGVIHDQRPCFPSKYVWSTH